MNKSATRFYWLDLFRFLAAIIVVLGHTRGASFVEFGALPADQKSLVVAAIFALTRIGNEAVVIFFVLSGFLVGGRAFERIANNSFQPTDYAIDRFSRIMLPLIPSLIFTSVLGIIMGGTFNLWHFVGNLLSLQGIFVPTFGGNAPLWSLTYEVWLYVLVWVVGVTILDRRLHLLSIILFTLICTMFIHLTAVYIYSWFIGAFAYICKPVKTSLLTLVSSTIVCLIAVIAVQIGTDSRSLPVESLRYLVPSADISRVLLAGGIGVLIQQIILINPKTFFTIKLDSAGTMFAASSYTLYLTHYSALQALAYFGLARSSKINSISIAFYGFRIVVCFIIAFTLYWLFERRTPELRRWIKSLSPERYEANILRTQN